MGVTRTLKAVALNAAVALFALATLAPLVWMVMVSLMATGESNTFPPPFVPAHATFEHYVQLFTDYHIGPAIGNSLIVAGLAMSLGLLFTVPAGYAFAKLKFAGRERIFKLLIATMVVPGQVAMLPLFLLLKWMGLVNSYAGVIAPGLAGIFAVMFVRQATLGIPDEMLDAGRIDGATELQIFWRIVVPLLRPVIVTLALFLFLASWNDFLWPLIVLTDQKLYTLPVALAALSREHTTDAELMMAGAVLTIVPVLALFLSLQRHYMTGIMGGAVKG